MKAVVSGMIATYPVGGVAWDYGQYLLGLEELGFEVFYLEDTASETYDPRRGCYGSDASYGVRFLAETMRFLSPRLGNRWHFRAADGTPYGLSTKAIQDAIASADLFLNVSGSALLRDEYLPNPRKVLIDTDPGWNHFVNYPRQDAGQRWTDDNGYRAHDIFYTYAELMGTEQCRLPDLGVSWLPTRPPVVTDRWKPLGTGSNWTTVLTWKNFQDTIEHDGIVFGTKEIEFPKIEALPALMPEHAFEIACGGVTAPVERWRPQGWTVVSSEAVSVTPESYQQYLQESRGELSVAKNVYVDTRSGWFSCRTACYLAASRPAVVQDTGFSEVLPTGHGLFGFTTVEEAREALLVIESDYRHHADAARQLAVEFLDAEIVLGTILERVGL